MQQQTSRYLTRSDSGRLQSKNTQLQTKGGRAPKFCSLFACENPNLPKYADLKARLRTFINWPRHINATAKEIAEAGFFFLEERDRCKCHYCGGGLQNWEKDDDPWLEHAKWFPQCEYVLQHCGIEYVSNVNAQFPNLSRPGEVAAHTPRDIPPPESSLEQDEMTQTTSSNDYDIPPIPLGQRETYFSAASVPSNMEIPPQYEREMISLTNMEIIEQFKAFGFEMNVVEAILDEKHRTNQKFESVSEMMIAAQEYEANLNPDMNMEFETSQPGLQSDSCSSSQVATQQSIQPATTGNCELANKVQTAIETTKCMTCGKEERSCMFMSCGHFCCCNKCGQGLHECPICNTKITSAIRIFRT